MTPRLVLACGILAFASNVYSLAFKGPQATVTSVVDERGISPKPTGVTKLQPELELELRKRSTGYAWECGWFSGTRMSPHH